MISLFTLGRTAIRTPDRLLDNDSPTLVLSAMFLAVARGRQVARDELLELFWPGVADAGRRHSLRSLLHRLKSAGVPLEVHPSFVTLDPTLVSADYHRFRDAQTLSTDDPLLAGASFVLPLAEQVQAAMSAPLSRWLEDFRSAVARDVARGLVVAIVAARETGDWVRVERLADVCRRVDPLNEEASLALAEALCMTASKERALAVLDAYSAQLGESRELRVPVRVLRERIMLAGTNGVAREVGRLPDAPFVGRSGLRRDLLAAFGEACRQHGGARVVWGPPGIGKSRLVAELAKDITLRDGTAVTLVCDAADGLRPLSVLFDLVPRLIDLPGALGCDSRSLAELHALSARPELSEDVASLPVPDESLRLRRQAALLDLLDAVADERPLAIFVDDAQWMDRALESFWAVVLPWSRSRAILWVFACRADSADAAIDTPFGMHVQPMQVAALDSAAAAELVAGLLVTDTATEPELVDRIAARGSGNPLVLREMVRHFIDTRRMDELPASIAPLIDDRLNRLSRPALRVLQATAILGALATVERVAALLELPRHEFTDAVGELAAAGILEDGSAGLVRCHAIWADGALGRLQRIVRAMLHRHAAERLELEIERVPALALLWECGRHWQLAGDGSRAITALERGAEHLVAHGYLHDAAVVYARAVEQCEDVDRRLALLRRRVRLLEATGEYPTAIEAIDEHERLAVEADPTYDAHSDMELRRLNAALFSHGDIRSVVAIALGCANAEHASSEHRLRAAKDCARMAEYLGLDDVLDQANAIAERLPTFSMEDRRCKRQIRQKYHLTKGDPRIAADLAREWIEDERATDFEQLHRALDNGMDAFLLAGRIPEAWACARELAALAEEKRRVGWSSLAYDRLICLAFEFDTPDVAEVWIQRVADLHARHQFGETPYNRIFLPAHWAQLAVMRGNGVEARRRAPALDLCLGTDVMRWRTRLVAVHLGAALACDDIATARSVARHVGEGFDRPGRWLDWPASIYATYLRREHGRDAATTFVHRYVSEVRRELYPAGAPLHAYLDDAARESV